MAVALLERPVASSAAPWMGRKAPHAEAFRNPMLDPPRGGVRVGRVRSGLELVGEYREQPVEEGYRPSLVVKRASRGRFGMPPGGPR